MLRKAKDLLGVAIVATDGAIGDIEDLYFDDQWWGVRYLVINTGTWLSRQQVLISPRAILHIDLPGNQLHVNLTKEQVQNSPDIDTRQPVSRQHETAFADYYGYPYYWHTLIGDPFYPTINKPTPLPKREEKPVRTVSAEASDPHLRSLKTVTGYYIEAADGEIGHAADFILDDENQVIRYLVVATRNWLPGDKVLIAPSWIERISWEESKIFVRLTKEVIRNSPTYDEAALTREYEKKLYHHYNLMGYWPDDGFE
jgi:hypothetical protein